MKELAEVKKKTAEDLAESLEIMMVETRPVGEARKALRGACCLLRKETTTTTVGEATHILNALIDRWATQQRQARAFLCQRAKEMIG